MTRRRPTIEDVARAADVSKGAVSFALNDRPGVSETTRARIREVAAGLGWTPSHRARALSTSRAWTLGLVVNREPELLGVDPFFAPFIAGVESVLAASGFALLLQVVTSDDAELQAYTALATSGRVDGVLLTDLRVDDPRPELLTSLALPAVAVGRPRRPVPVPAVVLDDQPAIREAVTHLVSLGHRAVGYVGGPATYVHGASRREAWSQGLLDAGLPEGPAVEADFTARGGAEATQHLLGQPDPPTALVYANDVMAVSGISMAAARGRSVPADLSVTGFDDIELSAHLDPPLTTVRVDVQRWGRTAATALLSLVDGHPQLDVELPPAKLVLRGSTAPPRTSQPRTSQPRTSAHSTEALHR